MKLQRKSIDSKDNHLPVNIPVAQPASSVSNRRSVSSSGAKDEAEKPSVKRARRSSAASENEEKAAQTGTKTDSVTHMEEEKESMPPCPPDAATIAMVSQAAQLKAIPQRAMVVDKSQNKENATVRGVSESSVTTNGNNSTSTFSTSSAASIPEPLVSSEIVRLNPPVVSRPFHMPNPREHRRFPLQQKSSDPAKCVDRIDDMYELYYEQERIFMARPYMDQQTDINRKMRSILVDWLVDVHNRFKLQPLTLWLTVNILDRYLMEVQTVRSKVQLVGVSALFIACKYEEIFPPFLKDCVTITDNTYKPVDVLAMERQILVTLNYNIFVPTGYHFLTRYLNCISASDSLRHLASYYAERNLQEYDSLNQEPHMVAATAIFAAKYQQEEACGRRIRNLSDLEAIWKHLAIETGFRAETLLPYATLMIRHVSEEPETASKRRLTACKKKYSLAKYGHVSACPLPSLTVGEKLP